MTDEASLKADWRKWTAAVFLFGVGFSIYSGVFQNFLRTRLRADELGLGVLESLREVPGLLTALTMVTLVALAESRVAAIGLLVTAVGIGVSGLTASIPQAVGVAVFWSIGFHLYATMSSPITLSLAKGQEGGRHLGRMQGIGGLATILGLALGAGMSLFVPQSDFEPYFLLGGILIFAAAVLTARLGHHAAGGKRSRLIVRREYSLFYLLSFLEGCRRQIFAIFASFALIKVYGLGTKQMLALYLINAVIIAITAPRMGKIIDQKGERGPLIFYAIGLILVFLGYALSQRVEVLIALFLIDNVLFSFSVGFTTYLHRIVRPGEMTPCVSMGITMNHIAAVTVPIGGALLWKASGDYRLPFVAGTILAVGSLFATMRLPRKEI
ncbi:MFS transporter [bacterium]|nr:MAG: MFS transporter [bacterium]